MTKIYGLYNIKDYEQCEYFGTMREIAEYLHITKHGVASYMCRKRQGKQKYLLHKYDLVEMEEINE